MIPNPLDATPIGLPLRILGFFKRIPGWVWIVLAVVAIIGIGVWRHSAAVEAAHDAAYAQGSNDTREAFRVAQAKADARQRVKVEKIVKASNKISQEINNALVVTNDDIDARAHQLSLRHDAAIRKRDAQRRNLPASGAVAAGAGEAPAQDGLPWSVALPLMTQAAKNLAQLNAILDHEEAQQALAAQ